MKSDLIVALDVDNSVEAADWIERLPQDISYYKIGLELFVADGAAALAAVHQRQKHIFLDLKLHDIPRTVARAVQSAARHHASLLTVHAAGGRAMLQEAAKAAKDCGPERPRLVAVTTLTSLDQNDLEDVGVQRSIRDQALALADLALSSGIDGLVTSVHEAPALREEFGHDPILVTPGIRLRSEATADRSDSGLANIEDQKRVATPATAVQAGSTYLVVGRAILNAADPSAAAIAVLDEMNSAAVS